MVMAGTAAAGALAISNSAQCEANDHQGANQQDMNEDMPVYASSSDPMMVGGENGNLEDFYFVTSSYNNQEQVEDPSSDLNKGARAFETSFDSCQQILATSNALAQAQDAAQGAVQPGATEDQGAAIIEAGIKVPAVVKTKPIVAHNKTSGIGGT